MVDNTKKKSKERTRQSPINFVVPMQLEECMYRLENVERASMEVEIKHYKHLDKDYADFFIKTHSNGATVMKVSGTLKRWEGVSTQFDGKMQMIVDPIIELVTACVILFGPTLLCGLINWLTHINMNIPQWANGIWIYAIFGGYAAVLFLIHFIQKQADQYFEDKFKREVYNALGLIYERP
jgi:hypothetical protein